MLGKNERLPKRSDMMPTGQLKDGAVVEREPGLQKAIKAAGGIRALARLLGISQASVAVWHRIPADRILEIEAGLNIPREELRPDLYRRS